MKAGVRWGGVPLRVRQVLVVLLGMASGLAYWKFIGCTSDSCPITSNPWTSLGYGGLMGWLLAPRGAKVPGSDDKKNHTPAASRTTGV